MKNHLFKKGMTLVEIVVSLALVALSIGGILSVLIQSANLAQSVDYAYIAADLAKNRIEWVREIRRDMGYDALPGAAETDTVIDRNGVADSNGDFMRTTLVNASYGTYLTKVTVKVIYKKKGVFTPVPTEIVTLISFYR